MNALKEIAHIIAAEVRGRRAYRDADYTLAMASRQNEDGWTIETGHGERIVRTEGVHLAAAELGIAYRAGVALANLADE